MPSHSSHPPTHPDLDSVPLLPLGEDVPVEDEVTDVLKTPRIMLTKTIFPNRVRESTSRRRVRLPFLRNGITVVRLERRDPESRMSRGSRAGIRRMIRRWRGIISAAV